ncbi:luciferin 4-monooxygenase-like [Ischnura elegans]|uniref:luciferin 4-monooxygenase-like n=1 Tax=Ischnura elegans TaxID=197161 RepID=UPI001ED8BD35|nr:luciferin 4-monooxygenase-like [Ischnura elegans]
MKGYINFSNKEGFRSVVDEDGWLDTGDLGFFDNDDHLYVIERLNMIFKYLMHQVSPVDIEGVILQHPSVQSVGVVGVPNPETTSAARAYVVIKPGCRVTEEEIKAIVADNMPFYKHLHGGVVFMDKLPESRGGKVDKPALLKQAIREKKS